MTPTLSPVPARLPIAHATLLALLLAGFGCFGAAATTAEAAVVASVFSGRIPCVETDGIQYCQGSPTTRVETWDGVPLDVDVTLPPASMDGPFPLVIELHGWSLGKTGAPSVDRALAGYVVLNYTARGFHQSCGPNSTAPNPDPSLSDPNACDDRGWTHLGDARYEGRDSQYLAGLLVDEGLVVPNLIGATGVSYGGGRSMVLAALKNRVMLPDGSLVPWTSPLGTPMEIAAAAPLIPWSDLAYSLVPNGATLDYRADNPYGTRGGVQKSQWNSTLLLIGGATGFYAPVGVDPEADLIGFNARVVAGEPYDADPLMEHILDQFTTYRSAYYMVDAVEPAPLFIYNAWTDDLFPAHEGLRMWRKVKAAHPAAEVDLHFADAFGHPRSGLGGDTARVDARVQEFFDFHLKGIGSPIPALEVYTQPCGGSTEVGPISAADWDAIHPGEVTVVDPDPRTITESGNDQAVSTAVAPINGGPCRTIAAADDPAAATYVSQPASGGGYTLVGSPTVVAEYTTVGAEYAQIAARLWDVDGGGGTQSLISHGWFRPRADNLGPQVFQLPANGWQMADGHSVKLELVGQSSPAGRASNGTFSVTISDLELRLPVLDAPNGGSVAVPAAHVLPPADPDAPQCPPTPVTCGGSTKAGASKVKYLVGAKPDTQKLIVSLAKLDTTAYPELAGALLDGGLTACVYDGTDTLLLSSKAPSSGDCSGAACWREKDPKLLYADKKNARTGTKTVKLKAGAAGKAAIKLQGKGPKLGVLETPIATLPLSVQVRRADGTCWGATFSVAKQNDVKGFNASSD